MPTRKKKKVNLLGAFYGLGKGLHENYEKKHHPNRRKRPRSAPKRVPVKRVPNNHESTRGKQMK